MTNKLAVEHTINTSSQLLETDLHLNIGELLYPHQSTREGVGTILILQATASKQIYSHFQISMFFLFRRFSESTLSADFLVG